MQIETCCVAVSIREVGIPPLPKRPAMSVASSKPKITNRIDAITQITPEYRCDAPPVPHSVKIELTARCDFNCFFCATAKRLRHKADIDPDLYRRIVRELRDAGVEELGLIYLGESFLCHWLPEAIRYAKQDCGYPYIFLTTNGRLATRDRVAACMAAGLDSLKFSFNNADAEQFASVTRVPGREFRTVVENIKAAQSARDEGGYRCGLYASSIRYDGEQLQRMEQAVAEILPYVDEHYWLPLYGQAGLTAGTPAPCPWPAIQDAWTPCASRFPAGQSLPRATSLTTAASLPVASIMMAVSRWAT